MAVLAEGERMQVGSAFTMVGARRWLALWALDCTLHRHVPPLGRCLGVPCLRFQCNALNQIVQCAYYIQASYLHCYFSSR